MHRFEKFFPKTLINAPFIESNFYNFYGHKVLNYYFEDIVMINNIPSNNEPFSLLTQLGGDPIPEALDEIIFWIPEHMTLFCDDQQKFNDELKKRYEYVKKICNKNKKKNKINLKTNTIKLDGCYVDLTHPFGYYVYGHFFDTLQKLIHFKNIIKNKDIKFIISKIFKIKDFKTHLSILCEREIEENDLVRSNNKNNFLIESLHYGLSPAIPTQMTQETYSWIVPKYWEYFKIKNPEPQYNLYLDRNHVLGSQRGVINNNEVLKFLRKNNFIRVTGNESLSETIEYFSNARYVIGTHGAAFANCMFCNPWTKILEFCPQNRENFCYLWRFKIAQDYTHLLVEADRDYNLKIDIEYLNNFIN